MATGQTYQVQGGDNLVSIARNIYGAGNERMFAEIMRLNGLGSGVIRPGMVLRIPNLKPSSQIFIQGANAETGDVGTMAKLKAENDYYKAGGTGQWDPSKIAAGQPGSLSTTFNQANLANVPTSITPEEVRQATGTGGLIPGYVPPTTAGIPTPGGTASPFTAEYQPNYNTDMRGRGYQSVTQRQYLASNLAGSGFAQAVFGGVKAGAAIGGFLGGIATPVGVGAIPGSISGGAVGGYYSGLGYATNKLAPIVAGSFKQTMTDSVQSFRDFLGRPVDPVTGQPILTPQSVAPPVNAAPAAVYGQPKTVQPAGVGRVTGIPEPTYTIAEPTFNTVTPSVPKSTFTEANLPDPSIQTNLDPTNLQALGMNQSQAALYLRVITSDNPSIEDAQQFKYVFNVSDTSQLGQLLNEAIVATPSTNDQLMSNIYDDIMNLGYFGTMPSQAYAPGGGGGGGGGGNGGASNYSGGSTWSYGGLR